VEWLTASRESSVSFTPLLCRRAPRRQVSRRSAEARAATSMQGARVGPVLSPYRSSAKGAAIIFKKSNV
jgi:hypothetical protein